MEAQPFEGIDFYDVSSEMSEDEKALRDRVRAWVDDAVLPIIDDAFLENRFPKELVAPMGAMGLLGVTIPTEYGGAGGTNLGYGVAMQELERGDSGIRSFASAQGALVMYPINRFGSEEQKREWLPKLAKGEKIGCFGLTEPDCGSNPTGMTTRAERTSDGWVVNGSKTWITNGTQADVAIVWAQTAEVGDSRGIRGFLVPSDTPGFSARKKQGKLSLRASDTSVLTFEDMALPESALLGGTEGVKSALSCLNEARFGVVWGVVGAAMACLDVAIRYSRERVVFGGPLGGKQIQQARIADMLTGITNGQLIALRMARLKDRRALTPQQISLAKRYTVSMAADVAREARRLLGGNGITVQYAAMRHMSNLESVYTYEGTHDIHSLILGQAVTGIAAY